MENARQAVNFREGIHVRGDLVINVFRGDPRPGDEPLRRIEIRNKIMFLAADVLVALLAQRSADYPGGDAQKNNDKLYTMRMGTSNTAPSRADTNLGNPVAGVVLADPAGKVTSLPGELQLLATLATTDANGFTLCEAAVFTKGAGNGVLDAPGASVLVPRMFSRQVHPGIPKTNAISLQYAWTYAFTA